MTKKILLALASAVTLGLGACGESDDPKGPAPSPTPPPQTQSAAPTPPLPTAPQPSLMDKALEVAKEARQATREEATRAVETARASANEAFERGRVAAERAAERGRALGQAALQQGVAIAEAHPGYKAESLIRQAQDAIDQKRPEVAREIAERLHQVKESLPKRVQDELDRLDARLAGSQPTPPVEAAAPPSY